MTTEMCPRASLRSVHSAPYELGVCVCVVTTWIMYQKNLVGTIHASDRSLVNRSRPVLGRCCISRSATNTQPRSEDESSAMSPTPVPASAPPTVRNRMYVSFFSELFSRFFHPPQQCTALCPRARRRSELALKTSHLTHTCRLDHVRAQRHAGPSVDGADRASTVPVAASASPLVLLRLRDTATAARHTQHAACCRDRHTTGRHPENCTHISLSRPQAGPRAIHERLHILRASIVPGPESSCLPSPFGLEPWIVTRCCVSRYLRVLSHAILAPAHVVRLF